MTTPSPLALFARHELLLALRSRWTQIFTVVFAALALGVAASGYILVGGSGVQDFARTSASLVQLVLLLVPLASLLMGVMALTPERGAAELVFAQPVARRTVLLGKLGGLFAALGAAELVGFGIAGVVIFWRSGSEGVAGFLLLVLAALTLTAVFLAISAWIAAGTLERGRARVLALALTVWFGALIVFDLAALGLASLLPSGLASRVLIVAVLINPADAIRTGALLAAEGTTAFGAASLAFLRFTNGTLGAGLLLAASVLFWMVLPLGLAIRRLERCDL